jgi:hypothetical protein
MFLTSLLCFECTELVEKTHSKSNIVLLSQLTIHSRMQIYKQQFGNVDISLIDPLQLTVVM